MIAKEDWLEAALSRLLQRGADHVNVEPLARDLGVTKGSFYWHFTDRADLLRQVAAYWEERQLLYLSALRDADHETPEDRLAALLDFTATKDASADVALRLWARREDWVKALVADIDRLRLAYCEEVFLAMGFEEDAARLRAHLVYYYQIAEQTISYQEPAEVRQRLGQLRYDLLVARV